MTKTRAKKKETRKEELKEGKDKRDFWHAPAVHKMNSDIFGMRPAQPVESARNGVN